jgi:hypothetical protein
MFFCYFCSIPLQRYYAKLTKLVSISKKYKKNAENVNFSAFLGVECWEDL